MKKIIGIIIFLVGIALILLSQHIKHEVAIGRGRVSSAQQQLDTGTGLFSVNPYSKEAGKIFTSPIQKKINQGEHNIAYYENMAKWLQIGGIILLIVGVGVVFFGKKKK